jgi:aspartate racemase
MVQEPATIATPLHEIDLMEQLVRLKTIGLIGGTSGFATREYYRRLDEGVQAALGGQNAAEILLYSVNFENIRRCIENGRWDDVADYLVDKALRLERGGADFVLLVSNTLHRVADKIAAATHVPFVDMLDLTATTIREKGLRKVGMLGTLPVMRDEFYRERYGRHGVDILSPDEADQREVNRVIFDELCRGRFLPTSKANYRAVIEGMRQRGAEGVVLGCTEIGLLIDESGLPDLPVFDTTDLHCQKAIELALEGRQFEKSRVIGL